ncbi:MAG: hypothetical protein ACRD0N_09420 [Acidimicrobiales bacterium]
MGKASSSKKVARAASTGGGRTSRGSRPRLWYASMALVALLGSLVIVTSRNERQAASNPLKSEKPRPADSSRNFAGDHWHAAYGIYICDQFLAPIQSDRDPLGIHTHNEGVVHIHPFTRAASGRKATFGVFADTVGLEVDEDSVKVPGGKKYSNGDKCGSKAGELQWFLNGKEQTGDPKKLRPRDRDLIVIAFAPGGAEFPKEPPSKSELDNLSDVIPNPAATTTSVPGAEGTATTVPSTPADTSATTAPTSDTTTATTAATTSSSTP